MHPNTAAALKAGRARWLQRMRLAKQEGLIERFPNGRRARGAPKLHPDRTIRRAQKIIEARMAKEPALRVVRDPGVDEDALEPRAAPLEQSTAATRPQAAANAASAVTAAESFGEAEELLENLLAALLEAPNPFDEADADDSLWSVVAAELPDELYDRLDSWLTSRLMGTG
jgi:hypothetical protein